MQTGTRTVTGTVERALDATSDKATVDVTLEYVTGAVKQYAVLVENVPNAIMASIPQFTAWANSELDYQVRLALDAAIVDAIFAANPVGQTGSDYVTQVRQAVAVMRSAGGNPQRPRV